jgi:hypothetical protein
MFTRFRYLFSMFDRYSIAPPIFHHAKHIYTIPTHPLPQPLLPPTQFPFMTPPRLPPHHLTPSSPSLAPTLTHNAASNLFNSGSRIVASAARPRYEWRISERGNAVSLVGRGDAGRQDERGGGNGKEKGAGRGRKKKGGGWGKQTRQIPGVLAKAANGVLGALEQVAPVGVEGGEVGFVEDLVCGIKEARGGERRDVGRCDWRRKGGGGYEGERGRGREVTESVPPTQNE